MDLATIIGLVLCFGFTMYGIISGDGFGVIGSFIDPGSVAITIGGAFSACLTMNKMPDFVKGLKGFGLALKDKKVDHAGCGRPSAQAPSKHCDIPPFPSAHDTEMSRAYSKT